MCNFYYYLLYKEYELVPVVFFHLKFEEKWIQCKSIAYR